MKGKRKQGREWDEKGHHRVKRCGTDGRIWCEKCSKSSNVERLTQWPLTKCRGNEAGGEGGEREGKGREETDKDKTNKKERTQKRSRPEREKHDKKKNNKTQKGRIRW